MIWCDLQRVSRSKKPVRDASPPPKRCLALSTSGLIGELPSRRRASIALACLSFHSRQSEHSIKYDEAGKGKAGGQEKGKDGSRPAVHGMRCSHGA